MSVHYIDSSLKTMQGEFTGFYKNGTIENQGILYNKLPDYCDDSFPGKIKDLAHS